MCVKSNALKHKSVFHDFIVKNVCLKLSNNNCGNIFFNLNLNFDFV